MASWFGDYGRCVYMAGFPHIALGSADSPNLVKNGWVIVRDNAPYVFNPSTAARWTNVGAVLMADELSGFPVAWYKYAPFVFRHYYDAARLNEPEGVVWVPNGFGNDPGNEECAESCRGGAGDWEARAWACFAKRRLTSERRYLLSFMGWVHNDNRRAMMAEFARVKSAHPQWAYFVQDAGGFGPKTGPGGAIGLSQTEMHRVMRDSMFCLAPCGNNPETHRLWESLWDGCIPIMAHCNSVKKVAFPPERNFLLHINKTMNFSPRMIVMDWAELVPLMEQFAAPMTRDVAWTARVNRLQQDIIDWYFCFLKGYASKMERLIAAHLVKD